MNPSLSEFELEVLQLFWQHGHLTAPETHRLIAKQRTVAYNTVKTIIDRLERKGALHRLRRYGRTILYEALLTREQVTRPMLKRFLSALFGGSPRALFANLLEKDTLNMDDIAYMERLLQKKRQDMEKSDD